MCPAKQMVFGKDGIDLINVTMGGCICIVFVNGNQQPCHFIEFNLKRDGSRFKGICN